MKLVSFAITTVLSVLPITEGQVVSRQLRPHLPWPDDHISGQDENVSYEPTLVEEEHHDLRLRRKKRKRKKKGTKMMNKVLPWENESGELRKQNLSSIVPSSMPSESPSEKRSIRPQQRRRLSESNLLQVPSGKKYPHMSTRAGLEIMPFYCGMWGTDLNAKARPSQGISIATQSDWGSKRLMRLVQMAQRWDGYISVTIYGKKEDEDQLLSEVESLWTHYAKELDGKVAMHLVIDKRAEGDTYYPHNILRNIAVEHTPTDLFFYNDVDFIPSYDAHASLLKHVQYMPQDDPWVLVLPAFERLLYNGEDETKISLDDLPSTKDVLLGNLITNRNRIAPFRESYSPGHGPTDYNKWYTSTKPYRVNFALNYEPYFVTTKKFNLPPFWEHFTGYGKNKQTWVEEIGVAGFNFFVSPTTFITHVNHNNDLQDERTVRTAMIDEYANTFQQYLVRRYGLKLWTDEDLAKWKVMNKRSYILRDIHMCKSAELKFSDGSHYHMRYQCSEGGKYKKFGRILRDYIVENITAPMGRRPFPIPSNSTVLILGNSHTRQMATTLLCQYSDSVDSFTAHSVGTGKTDYFTAHLHNGATLISLTNNPVMYSKDWKSLVEGVIGRSLSSLDGIVLGKFNGYSESKGTSFLKTVDDVAKKLNITIDFEHAQAPQLMDVAKVFDGPIVGVSMFGVQGIGQAKTDDKTKKSFSKNHRTNVDVIRGRKYIDEIGLECGTDQFLPNEDGGSDCKEMSKKKKNKNENTRPANEMHRCVGSLGGHPDLIAWEVVEFLSRHVDV